MPTGGQRDSCNLHHKLHGILAHRKLPSLLPPRHQFRCQTHRCLSDASPVFLPSVLVSGYHQSNSGSDPRSNIASLHPLLGSFQNLQIPGTVGVRPLWRDAIWGKGVTWSPCHERNLRETEDDKCHNPVSARHLHSSLLGLGSKVQSMGVSYQVQAECAKAQQAAAACCKLLMLLLLPLGLQV